MRLDHRCGHSPEHILARRRIFRQLKYTNKRIRSENMKARIRAPRAARQSHTRIRNVKKMIPMKKIAVLNLFVDRLGRRLDRVRASASHSADRRQGKRGIVDEGEAKRGHHAEVETPSIRHYESGHRHHRRHDQPPIEAASPPPRRTPRDTVAFHQRDRESADTVALAAPLPLIMRLRTRRDGVWGSSATFRHPPMK